MTGSEEKHGEEFTAVSRTLLRCATRGGPRTEFLSEASREILAVSGADTLDLWFEDGELCHHWHAALRPHPSFRLTPFSPGAAGEPGTRRRDARPSSDTFLERILPLMDDGERLAASAQRTPGGSLWVEEPARGSEASDRDLRSAAIVPFEIDGQSDGLLRLTSFQPALLSRDQVESLEDLAQLLSAALVTHRAQAALTERVKELTCMYRIAHIAAQPNLSLDNTLREIVELLPSAWQYPDITTARILLEDRTFHSRGFAVGPHCLAAEILAQGKPRGRVEVFYTDRGDPDRQPLLEDAPFLVEENHLIQAVARELTFIIERRHAEQEKRQLQDGIRHADRLATIGQLAAGVAHELNEPLGNILGFAQLAQKSPGLPDQTRGDIERIVKASLYAREIIRKLLFFSRQAPSRMMAVNLNTVVEDVLSLLESRCAKAGIRVVLGLSEELPVIRGDPAQLQQVVVNLVVNAIQAMPDEGQLRVAIQVKDDAVFLSVDDTGVGIPPENIQRVFAPFFTTKDVGQGTGLGLSVVHGIVSAHGGWVRVESKPGKGARFVIRLPQAGPTGEHVHGQ